MNEEGFVSLHSIYCDCERCKPSVCIHCGKPEKGHYWGVTGMYCIGFYDSTKKFTPAGGHEEHKATLKIGNRERRA